MSGKWKEGQLTIPERECRAYFKDHAVLGCLLRGFWKKYESYGAFAGSVVLRNLTGTEIEELEGFLGKNYHGQKSVSVSAGLFARALKNSRFEAFEPKEILELYFQEEMSGKKEREQQQQEQWECLFSQVLAHTAGTFASEWVKEMRDVKKDASSYLLKKYRESGQDIEEVRRVLELGVKMIHALPEFSGRTEYLAVYAANLTGNPHFFDDQTPEGQFLYQIIKWTVSRKHMDVGQSSIFPALYKQRLYLAAGILRDDISNYAMLSGVHARKKDGDIHAGMEGFFREGNMVHVPLSVIAEWSVIECPQNRIYIVENPSVYAMLCRKFHGQQACMCMNGQPRLSSVMVLDLLEKAKVTVCYAGDFDPEGLLIAQKVRRYYKGPFVYWHMSVADYERSKSQKAISPERLKSLERITDEELKETAGALLESGMAGYQENIWELYLGGTEPQGGI